jgi:hypothetical protein
MSPSVEMVCCAAWGNDSFWKKNRLPGTGVCIKLVRGMTIILSALGIGEAAAAETPAAGATPVSAIDVVSKLEGLAAANPEKLNWKVSIVDLLKLLGLDSSLSARKELAAELGCPAAATEDSAQMNMWLHKTVLQKLAENGGNIPPDLLH